MPGGGPSHLLPRLLGGCDFDALNAGRGRTGPEATESCGLGLDSQLPGLWGLAKDNPPLYRGDRRGMGSGSILLGQGARAWRGRGQVRSHGPESRTVLWGLSLSYLCPSPRA